jgi:hypothetical protein
MLHVCVLRRLLMGVRLCVCLYVGYGVECDGALGAGSCTPSLLLMGVYVGCDVECDAAGWHCVVALLIGVACSVLRWRKRFNTTG